MIIELMGRYAGWIALSAGLAGGADVILIPEIPFQWENVFRRIVERSRHGKRFSIIAVAEGARGDRREPIVLGDADCEMFLETFGEACQRSGFIIHAYVLLLNHYHLRVWMQRWRSEQMDITESSYTDMGNVVRARYWSLD